MKTWMKIVAEKIIARRYPYPKAERYDPNVLPDLSRINRSADGIRFARKRLTEIDRNLEIFRVARQTPLVKQFEERHGSESSEKRMECTLFYRCEHQWFRSIVDNLCKPMVGAIEAMQAAIEFLRDVPDGETRRDVLKELRNRVDWLMPFGDMVKHPESMDFYRKDLLDLFNQLSALAEGEAGRSGKACRFLVVDGDKKGKI
jgi:hypothetical protein